MKISNGLDLLSDLFAGVASLGEVIEPAGGRIDNSLGLNKTGKVSVVTGAIDNPRDWLARWGVPIEERPQGSMGNAAALFEYAADGDQLKRAAVAVPHGADINAGKDRWNVWHEIGHCCDYVTQREGHIIFTPHGMFSTQFIALLRKHQEVIITWTPHSDREYKTQHVELWAETVAAAIMDPARVPADLLAAITPALIERNLPVPSAIEPPASEPPIDIRAHGMAALAKLTHYMSQHQRKLVAGYMCGEEGDWFAQKMIDLCTLVEAMPKTYSTDRQGQAAIAQLHYFSGLYHYYIIEKDKGSADDAVQGVQHQAFGLADLFGDGGELGYISLPELFADDAELDFHFTPKSIAAIRGEAE